MTDKVSYRLLEAVNRVEGTPNEDDPEHKRGIDVGHEWAKKRMFEIVNREAPVTSDKADSQYNAGVLFGIALVFRAYAEQIDPIF